jgi:hypothetical protein
MLSLFFCTWCPRSFSWGVATAPADANVLWPQCRTIFGLCRCLIPAKFYQCSVRVCTGQAYYSPAVVLFNRQPVQARFCILHRCPDKTSGDPTSRDKTCMVTKHPEGQIVKRENIWERKRPWGENIWSDNNPWNKTPVGTKRPEKQNVWVQNFLFWTTI